MTREERVDGLVLEAIAVVRRVRLDALHAFEDLDLDDLEECWGSLWDIAYAITPLGEKPR